MKPSYMPAPAELTGQVVEAAPGCAARITLMPVGDDEAGNLAVLRSVVTGIQFREWRSCASGLNLRPFRRNRGGKDLPPAP